MRVDFSGCAYVGTLTYKKTLIKNDISTIFDTGCTTTSIGLYSLKCLLGCSYNDILSKIEDRYFGENTQDASGGLHGNVRITIPSIALSNSSFDLDDSEPNIEFGSFYCNLNIDDSLAKTDGLVINSNGLSFMIRSYILIGCDFIRTFDNITISKKRASLSKFNEGLYFKEVECNRGESFSI